MMPMGYSLLRPTDMYRSTSNSSGMDGDLTAVYPGLSLRPAVRLDKVHIYCKCVRVARNGCLNAYELAYGFTGGYTTVNMVSSTGYAMPFVHGPVQMAPMGAGPSGGPVGHSAGSPHGFAYSSPAPQGHTYYTFQSYQPVQGNGAGAGGPHYSTMYSPGPMRQMGMSPSTPSMGIPLSAYYQVVAVDTPVPSSPPMEANTPSSR